MIILQQILINLHIIENSQVAYKSSKNKSVSPIGPACAKKMYDSREEAEDMIRYIHENRYVQELHAYHCASCGLWHLSSKSK